MLKSFVLPETLTYLSQARYKPCRAPFYEKLPSAEMEFKMQWSILRNGVEGGQLSLLNALFDDRFATTDCKNVIEFRGADLADNKLLSDLSAMFGEGLEFQSNLENITLQKVWLVHSNSEITDAKKLPYLPHFDKRRFLKAMVYLEPVNAKNGAIKLGEAKDENAIEKRRRMLPLDYKEKGLNTISHDELREELVSVQGNAGDVIFFDTNVPHAAGIVDVGLDRKIARFDFTHPSFELKKPNGSIIDKIASRLRGQLS